MLQYPGIDSGQKTGIRLEIHTSSMVGQPAARPDANLESLWKLQQGSTPEPYIFLKLDDKAVPTRGRSWVVRDACSSNKRWSTFFFKIVWAFYGRDLTGFYQSFINVILNLLMYLCKLCYDYVLNLVFHSITPVWSCHRCVGDTAVHATAIQLYIHTSVQLYYL